MTEKTDKPILTKEERMLVNQIYGRMIRPIEAELVKLDSQVRALQTRFPSNIQEISSVDEFIEENEYAIVDFYSDYCLPCHNLTPALEAIATEDNGVAVGRLNLDKHDGEGDKYEATSIPLVISFNNGEIVQQSIGTPRNPEDIVELMRSLAIRVKLSDDEFDKMFTIVKKVAETKKWALNPDTIKLTSLISALALNKKYAGKQYCPCKAEQIPENVCPCRAVEDKYESSDEMIENEGVCYCGLFMSHEQAKELEVAEAEIDMDDD